VPQCPIAGDANYFCCQCHSILVNSPVRAVAKYCDERLSVCPPGYFRSHARDLYQFLRMLSTAVARSSSGMVTKSQGEGVILGVSFPLTIHCNVFAEKGISLSAGKGVMECIARTKCDLRLPCLTLQMLAILWSCDEYEKVEKFPFTQRQSDE